MADLFDRITTNPDNEKTISGHYLPGMIISYHNGKSASSIKTFFVMDTNAITDFDDIITHFDSLTQLQKLEFMHLMSGANTEIELGIITTKIQYTTFLGI